MTWARSSLRKQQLTCENPTSDRDTVRLREAPVLPRCRPARHRNQWPSARGLAAPNPFGTSDFA